MIGLIVMENNTMVKAVAVSVAISESINKKVLL